MIAQLVWIFHTIQKITADSRNAKFLQQICERIYIKMKAGLFILQIVRSAANCILNKNL